MKKKKPVSEDIVGIANIGGKWNLGEAIAQHKPVDFEKHDKAKSGTFNLY